MRLARSAVGVYCVENSKIVELQKSRERRPLANFCRCKAASLKLIKQIGLLPCLAIGRQRSYMFDITARPGWRGLPPQRNRRRHQDQIRSNWMDVRGERSRRQSRIDANLAPWVTDQLNR